MAWDEETVEFCGEIQHETEFAFKVYDGANTVWLPKSQIKEMRELTRKGDWEFVIPLWLAEDKEIV